jgi:transcriptional regulator with XRE-family HTH domain
LLFLRKRPEDSVLRLTDEWLDQYAAVGARIARWAASHRDEIATRVNAVEGLVGISDRANDNWGPLLAIAEVLGHRWADAVRKAAVKISLAADDESLDPGEQLLRDIQRVFNDARCPAEMTVDALYTALLRLPESLWAAMDSGHPLTKNRMGRILKSFGVHSTSTRLKRKGKSASAVERVYRYADLDGLFKRYCPPPSAEDAAPETQGHAPKLVANPRNAPPEAVAVRDLTSASQPATPADPPSAVPGGAWVTGQGVRALRKKLKLTQAELAMLVGVSAQSVTTWEGKKGKLSLRPATLKEVLAVRTMGVGAARQKLALLGGSLKKVGGGKKVPRRKKRSMRKVVRGTRKSRARQAVMPKRKNAGAN